MKILLTVFYAVVTSFMAILMFAGLEALSAILRGS